MKRFKFNLEKVLQLRQFKEEECKLALGQAISALNKIENDIKETALKRYNANAQRFNDTMEMLSWENYIVRLDLETEQLTEKAAQAQIVVEQKRAIYMEALRDLKAIEKLKEKQKQEYRKEVLYDEMNQVDELTTSRMMFG